MSKIHGEGLIKEELLKHLFLVKIEANELVNLVDMKLLMVFYLYKYNSLFRQNKGNKLIKKKSSE